MQNSIATRDVDESAAEARRLELARSYRESGEVLVQQTRPRLLQVARKLGLDLAAAKDVVQQAFVALFAQRPAARDVEAWLVRVVQRRGLDWRRREGVHRGVCPSTLPDEPVAQLSPEQRIAVRTVLDRLSARMRRLVEARYFEGLPESDAALVAGYAPASFKKTMTRALRTMRRELERGCQEKQIAAAGRQ